MLIRDYYRLTKPGIVYGNLLTAGAGFFLATGNHINLLLLVSFLSATALVIASGCVFNNIIDLEIDRKMQRTKTRPLVKGSVSVNGALLYAMVLGFGGFLILALFTNLLTFLTGMIGYVFYLGVYSVWKKKTKWATLLGSISGATPPVAGYFAVTNRVDTVSVLLFLTLAFWQMAHFYAISIYRFDEYKKANIPLWPIVRGIRETKDQILFFTLAFGASLVLFTYLNIVSFWFFIAILVIFLPWVRIAFQGFTSENEKNWARRFFLFSQLVILAFSVFISLDAFLLGKG